MRKAGVEGLLFGKCLHGPVSAYLLVRRGVCYLSGKTLVKIGPHKRLDSGFKSLNTRTCSI